MAHKRKYRLISLILVIVLLLTGAYLDQVAEKTFVLHGFMEDAAICSRLFQVDFNDVAACMTEMLNECSSMEQQSIELDPLLYLLCSNHMTLFAGSSFGHLETVQSLSRTSDSVVVDYMHQSDGKKRN